MGKVIAHLYRAFGATHDERVVAIVMLALVPAIPFLFALAELSRIT